MSQSWGFFGKVEAVLGKVEPFFGKTYALFTNLEVCLGTRAKLIITFFGTRVHFFGKTGAFFLVKFEAFWAKWRIFCLNTRFF